MRLGPARSRSDVCLHCTMSSVEPKTRPTHVGSPPCHRRVNVIGEETLPTYCEQTYVVAQRREKSMRLELDLPGSEKMLSQYQILSLSLSVSQVEMCRIGCERVAGTAGRWPHKRRIESQRFVPLMGGLGPHTLCSEPQGIMNNTSSASCAV